MEVARAKQLFMMLPFIVLVLAGAILILFASTTYWEEGQGRAFYSPLGVPGILAILVGGVALILLRLRPR